MSDTAIELELRDLNIQIGNKETEGDRPFFRSLLHEAFVFRRANGDVDDKNRFLEKLQESEDRHTDVVSIQLHGSRAVVAAVVTMLVDGSQARFHNLRLFVKDDASAWRLFAWANERIKA